jgi:hypothetical protein
MNLKKDLTPMIKRNPIYNIIVIMCLLGIILAGPVFHVLQEHLNNAIPH